jgi:hypothetical protein
VETNGIDSTREVAILRFPDRSTAALRAVEEASPSVM